MNSIRWRIALPNVILIIVLMLFVSGYFTNFIRQSYLSEIEKQLLSQARIISIEIAKNYASQFSSGLPFSETEALNQLTREWSKQTGMRYTLIRDDGVVIGESFEDRERMDNHFDRPEIKQARENGAGQSIRFSNTTGQDMMYVAVPIQNQSVNIGFTRVAMPIKTIQTDFKKISQVLVSVTFLSSLIAIILAMLIANQTTRPLREITIAATQISRSIIESEKALGKIKPSTLDEIGDLTTAFNTMVSKLRAHMTALETEQQKMASVLNEMSDGVLIVDEKSEIQLINPAAENIFDVTKEFSLGKSLVEVVRNHQILDTYKTCHKSQKQETVSFELGPKKIHIHMVASPLGAVMPGSTLLLFQDFTLLRKLETVRRDFISNISHELRTPLASLKILTETLLETAFDDPPAARRFLEQMETEVDALSLMVNELVELSRIESGKVPLQLEKTNPKELIKQAVARLQLQAERAELTIEINCVDTITPVLADSKRMEQVLVNLLHNAIKFTPAGGRIWVKARELEKYVEFSVQDSGIGISTEDLARIFERFYKVDRARSSGGTGLGLAIARHMVEAHGGKIWVVSREGQGSTFFFIVPKA
jgi:two-component system phosphate regulon sensor histidine kinase PhoR